MQGDAAAAGRDAATLRQRACLHPLLSSALPRLPLPSLYLREVTSEMLGQWLGGPATFSQDRPQGRDLSCSPSGSEGTAEGGAEWTGILGSNGRLGAGR